MRPAIALVLLVTALGCGPSAASRSGSGEPAPPKGKSHSEFLSSFAPQRPSDTVETDKMTLHVIDIGQGLAVLLEFPCGAVLFDTGGEENEAFSSTAVLQSYLEAFFTRRDDLNDTLSSLIISHPHIDHTRGIELVTAGYKPANVVTNGQSLDDLGGRPQMFLHSWVAERNGKKRRRRKANKRSRVGAAFLDSAKIPALGVVDGVIDPVGACEASQIDPKLTALWGQVHGHEDYPENPNDHSVVLRVDFGESSVLLTGDLELAGLDHQNQKYRDNQSILDVDVYVVGHHGSKNATAPHLMRAMSPKLAVISAGPYERDLPWTARKFGHPNIRAIEQLTDPGHGVAWHRDPKQVWVGLRGAWEETPSEFEKRQINRAVYATAWDGTVDVRLYGNGWLEVDVERTETARPAAD